MGKITTKWMRFIGNGKKLVALEVGDEKWVPESAVKEAVKAERARLREALPKGKTIPPSPQDYRDDNTYDVGLAKGFNDCLSEVRQLINDKEASKS